MGKIRTSVMRGFSLVELLVSMVLLSTIVLLASYSFSQFSRYWDGRLGNFDRSFTDLRNGWLLDDIIRNVHPYGVLNEAGSARFYFEGNINGFVAVASESISQTGIPAVIRLSLVQNNDQTFDLIYEEAPMSNGVITRLTSRIDFYDPVILFSDLINPKFSYYGPEPRQELRDGLDMGQRDVWAQSYNSAVTARHPKRIRFQWTRDNGKTDAWQLQLIQPLAGHLSSIDEDTGI